MEYARREIDASGLAVTWFSEGEGGFPARSGPGGGEREARFAVEMGKVTSKR